MVNMTSKWEDELARWLTRHDVGLVVPKGAIEAPMTEYIAQLGSARKDEEARADLYAATVMQRSCFSGKIGADAKRACVVSAYSTMVVYGLTMWGKTKEALCARYFDPSVKYPNLHLRALMRDALMSGNLKAVSLFADFLSTRAKLARAASFQRPGRCVNGIAATFKQ